MSGLTFLAILALLWSGYALIGAFAAFGGHERMPRFVQPLLQPTVHQTSSWLGRAGAAVVGITWLVLALLPELLLLREVVSGRTSPWESAAIAASVIGAMVWLGVLTWRYRL